MTQKSEEEEETVVEVLDDLLDDLKKASGKRVKSGNWDGTLIHFRSAKGKLVKIIETLEFEEMENEE